LYADQTHRERRETRFGQGGTRQPWPSASRLTAEMDCLKLYVEKLLSLEPNFTIEGFAKVYPFKHASDATRYTAGLRLAGVPDR
jgi:hypothetical protein